MTNIVEGEGTTASDSTEKYPIQHADQQLNILYGDFIKGVGGECQAVPILPENEGLKSEESRVLGLVPVGSIPIRKLQWSAKESEKSVRTLFKASGSMRRIGSYTGCWTANAYIAFRAQRCAQRQVSLLGNPSRGQ